MTKEITVLKRAEVKKASESYNVVPGDLICIVKGSTGNTYTTILRRNKQHSCTCPGNAKAHCKCYHIKELVKIENARYDAAKAVKEAERVIAEAPRIEQIAASLNIPVEEVEKIAVIAADYQQEIKPKHTEMCKPIGPRDTKKDWTKTPNNPRAFQMMR